jgi:hypothetical protein
MSFSFNYLVSINRTIVACTGQFRSLENSFYCDTCDTNTTITIERRYWRRSDADSHWQAVQDRQSHAQLGLRRDRENNL